jgi:MoaA/NifB/PqqE/SkfB family radical SAM enzyme
MVLLTAHKGFYGPHNQVLGDKQLIKCKMKLEEIGFYTFSDKRAQQTSGTSPLWRGEILLTSRCNFHCTYCQGLNSVEDIPEEVARNCIELWQADGLKNIRFSGGEPTLHSALNDLVQFSRRGGVERIGLSTNGSRSLSFYEKLIRSGVDDFAISLDASEPVLADKLAGVPNQWKRVIANIKELAKMTYVSVSIVLTNDNLPKARDIIHIAHEMNVADIRIATSSQYNRLISDLDIEDEILNTYPILKYRLNNFKSARNIRGIRAEDCHHCHLVKDDSIVVGKWHYPCGVYVREGGEPIGVMGPAMRQERVEWSERHNTIQDKICRRNCSDMYVDYNNRVEQFLSPNIDSNGTSLRSVQAAAHPSQS